MENTDIRIQNMKKARATAEEKAQLWNDYQGDKEHTDDIAQVELDMKKAIDEYNTLAQRECFDICKASADPMLKACETLNYGTIATKDEKIEGTNTVVKTIVDRQTPIDLQKLDKHCSGIGQDRDWLVKLEAFNYRMALRVAGGLNAKNLGELKDTYAISDLAKEADIGKNPVSNGTILKTLRSLVSAMIGETYANKVLTHDVRYILATYSQKSSKATHTAKLADHKRFRNLMLEVCNNAITGVGYNVEYKAK